MPIGKSFETSLQEQLKDKEVAIEFIREAMENPASNGDDVGYLMKAIGQVAKAHGIESVAERSGMSKSTIYQCIREDSNPTLRNVLKVLDAVGIRLTFEGNVPAFSKPVSALDVASYIMQRIGGNTGNRTTFWLQKLVYYSQVKSLINFKEPLFFQGIEAWGNGPVVKDLYDKHKGVKHLRAWDFSDLGNENNLSRDQKLATDWALEKYGDLHGDILSELTHSEDPWRLARGDLPDEASCSDIITNESIIVFYTSRPDYEAIEEREA